MNKKAVFFLYLLLIITVGNAQRNQDSAPDNENGLGAVTYHAIESEEEVIEEQQKAVHEGEPIPDTDLTEDESVEDIIDETIDKPLKSAMPLTKQDLEEEKEVQQELVLEEKFDVDIEKLRKQVINLVDRGVTYFQQHSLDEACTAFTHTKQFVEGDRYLFVYDVEGNVYAHGNDTHLLWKNLYDATDSFNTPFVKNIIKTAVEGGGGWLIYEWRNAPKSAYVKPVEKEGKTYIVGSGYYSHSKADAVVNLIKGAVALFEKGAAERHPASWAFSRISYPIGSFVYGDLYLYALDFDGNIMAQGERPGLIGSNALDYQDERGVFVNRKIIEELKKSGGKGVWVEYISKNAPKIVYAEQVVDAEGKEYFIACGYYPDANRKHVVDLVRRGYQFMKMNGLGQSVEAFQERRDNEFLYGDLYLYIFDLKGKLIADGRNPDIVGQNRYDLQDQDGAYYVRELIKKAKNGGGWVNAKIKNTLQANYVELVDLGIEKFVVGGHFTPISKQETMTLLVESGAGFFEVNDRTTALSEFVDAKSKFIRGDLYLFVFDITGICYAYGTYYNLIWRNMLGQTDDNGRPFVKQFINTGRRGESGIVQYRMNNEQRVSYVKGVIKGDKRYVIGSGYYL